MIPSPKLGRTAAAAAIKPTTGGGIQDFRSGPAGRAVASKAGGMVKKTVLQLGGSDPYLVLEDADLEQAAVLCARGRLFNNGPNCLAAKRFIIVDKVRSRVAALFVERLGAAKFGDP